MSDTMHVDSMNDCRCIVIRGCFANFGANLRESYVDDMSHFLYASPESETNVRVSFW
jgi:hypothetical protein